MPSNQEESDRSLVIRPKNEAEVARAIQEVQGAIVIAKKCPRDVRLAKDSIIESCKHLDLAEESLYAFKTGSGMSEGASIRLTEEIALAWGNMSFGVREVARDDKETRYSVFSHDLQNNVKSSMEFTQKHQRYSKESGNYAVTTDADIYNVVASTAARRKRACMLGVIPKHIQKMAVNQCKQTLASQAKGPIEERIKEMVVAFDKIGVPEDKIIKRLGHNLDAITEIELVTLRGIFQSIRDNMAKKEEWFTFEDNKTTALKDVFLNKEEDAEKKTLFQTLLELVDTCCTPDDLDSAFSLIGNNEKKLTEKEIKTINEALNSKFEEIQNGKKQGKETKTKEIKSKED